MTARLDCEPSQNCLGIQLDRLNISLPGTWYLAAKDDLPDLLTFSRTRAGIRQDDVIFYMIKKVNTTSAATASGWHAGVSAAVGGAEGGITRSREMTGESLAVDRIVKHDFDKGRYGLVLTFRDFDLIHSQITVAVCFEQKQAAAGGNSSASGKTWHLHLLDIKQLNVNNMLIVTDKRLEKWEERHGDGNTLEWPYYENDVLDLVIRRQSGTSSSTA